MDSNGAQSNTNTSPTLSRQFPSDFNEFLFAVLDLPVVMIRTFVVGNDPFAVCKPFFDLLDRRKIRWGYSDVVGPGHVRIVLENTTEAFAILQDGEVLELVKSLEGGADIVPTASLLHDPPEMHLAPLPNNIPRWSHPSFDPFSPSFSPREWLDSHPLHDERWNAIERFLPALKATGALAGGFASAQSSSSCPVAEKATSAAGVQTSPFPTTSPQNSPSSLPPAHSASLPQDEQEQQQDSASSTAPSEKTYSSHRHAATVPASGVNPAKCFHCGALGHSRDCIQAP
ncbi:hypothetical protein JCM11251_007643 [Rhodosporidiobolus azoricus]